MKSIPAGSRQSSGLVNSGMTTIFTKLPASWLHSFDWYQSSGMEKCPWVMNRRLAARTLFRDHSSCMLKLLPVDVFLSCCCCCGYAFLKDPQNDKLFWSDYYLCTCYRFSYKQVKFSTHVTCHAGDMWELNIPHSFQMQPIPGSVECFTWTSSAFQ